MARNTQLAVSLRNAQGDALARRLDGGYLRLYSGSQPLSADTALTTQALLVEVRFANPSAPAVTSGVVTFNPLTTASVAVAGTAAFFRAVAADGSTTVLDGSVGLPEDLPNLSLANPALSVGGQMLIDSFTHTVLASVTGA